MPQLLVFMTVIIVVTIMIALGVFIFLSQAHRNRVRAEFRSRLYSVFPSLGILGFVLLLNALIRRATEQISWILGLNISGLIYQIEGNLVAEIQRIESPELTAYFSFIYVFGYTFLLIFPLIAYFSLKKLQTFHEIAVAYTANYGIGLICYLLFIAYGPRNLAVAQQFMYDVYPQATIITFAINIPTNVFPSLHTSLAVTVMLFAWYTRHEFKRWYYVAVLIGMSVVFSTMYLGIHWAIDVLGGIILGYLSFRIGLRYADAWMRVHEFQPVDLTTFRHRF